MAVRIIVFTITTMPTEHTMSPIPLAASPDQCSEGCDKVIIQTFEGDLETMNLRLTATIVTSMAELRARAPAFKD
jgi:hypothetical protein